MKYEVMIEKGPKSYGAFLPDLPGCVAVGSSRAEVLSLIREAVSIHIEGMNAQGMNVPAATAFKLIDLKTS